MQENKNENENNDRYIFTFITQQQKRAVVDRSDWSFVMNIIIDYTDISVCVCVFKGYLPNWLCHLWKIENKRVEMPIPVLEFFI